jgi:hypothetical protein
MRNQPNLHLYNLQYTSDHDLNIKISAMVIISNAREFVVPQPNVALLTSKEID